MNTENRLLINNLELRKKVKSQQIEEKNCPHKNVPDKPVKAIAIVPHTNQ